MNLLEHELVVKYFGADLPAGHYIVEAISHRIIKAMCEPLKKGERFLSINERWDPLKIIEQICVFDTPPDNFHPYSLRLPDKFQCYCSSQDVDCSVHPGKSVDESKIGDKNHCEHPFAFIERDSLKGNGVFHCSYCDMRLFVPDIRATAVEIEIEGIAKRFPEWTAARDVLYKLVKLARK